MEKGSTDQEDSTSRTVGSKAEGGVVLAHYEQNHQVEREDCFSASIPLPRRRR